VKAAVYHGAGDIRIEDVPEPSPGPGELLLEIHAAGVCGTDVGEYVQGPASYAVNGHPVTGHRGPLIPGHELAGRVVARGAGAERFPEGCLVASGAGISCGECFQCRAGRTNLCLQYWTVGLHRDGALAQFCAVPASTCVDVAAYGLDEETAALAQPMAIAVHSMRRGRLEPGDEALVIGAGGIGAFLAFAAARLGARVTVVDVSVERLELASALGADELIRPEPGVRLRDALSEQGVTHPVVYEASGSAAALDEAMDVLPSGARLVVIGLQAQPRLVDLRRLTLAEVEYIGTNAHVCDRDLPEALSLLAQRGSTWSDVAPVVLPLHELTTGALEPMAEGRSATVKTLVDPWATARRERRAA
jgi:(R,R)-butanediol dehydrogenase / meso-butanediol dehydrogenase / diacetyl reductase